MTEQQQKQQYLQTVLSNLGTAPEKLTKDELRLATKYQTEMQRLNQVQGELGQLRDQLRQGEARVRSLELQAADVQGKANGFLEYLTSLKFEVDPVPTTSLKPVKDPTKEKKS
jgi:chromosome segregation ATPase